MVLALIRLGRFKILDAKWRASALAGLRARFRFGAPDPAPAAPNPAATEPPPSVPAASPTPERERPTLAATPAAAAEPELRRGEMRARFDALFDRMLALEDTMDALGKRFALRGIHERRAEQRAIERIENITETMERRGVELDALSSVLGRIETRLERIERRLRHTELGAADEATPTEPDDLAVRLERVERAASESRRLSRHAPEDALEFLDAAPFSTSSMRGNLAELSLPTVLGMLELERRTGVLKVSADDGSVVSATLRDGALVGARVQDLDADPVDALREALRFKRGHFWFRQVGVEVALGPPTSVGSVLLEATRRNDEALRSA